LKGAFPVFAFGCRNNSIRKRFHERASFPAKDKLTLCLAHVACRMGERFALRDAGIDRFEVRSFDDLKARIKKMDVLLCSGL